MSTDSGIADTNTTTSGNILTIDFTTAVKLAVYCYSRNIIFPKEIKDIQMKILQAEGVYDYELYQYLLHANIYLSNTELDISEISDQVMNQLEPVTNTTDGRTEETEVILYFVCFFVKLQMLCSSIRCR